MKTSYIILTSALMLSITATSSFANLKKFPFEVADKNKDGSVDLAELTIVKQEYAKMRAEKKGKSADEVEKLVKKTIKRAKNSFKAADANQDGKLDSAEYAESMKKN
jgi:Ca2+-binding EF-hand superfamily protein